MTAPDVVMIQPPEVPDAKTYVHRVPDGKLTRLEKYFSREQALEAAAAKY